MPGGNYAGKVGCGVGVESWLDSGESKVKRYWRAIEEGDSHTVGTILIGLWGDRAGSNLRPNFLRGGQELAASGGSVGQKWVAFGEHHDEASALKRARFAFWYYITDGRMGRPDDSQLAKLRGTAIAAHDGKRAQTVQQSNRAIFFWVMTKTTSYKQVPFVRGRVRKSMAAHHYYVQAAKNIKPAQRELDILRERIGPMIEGVFSQAKARRALAADSYSSSGTVNPREGPARLETSNAGPYLEREMGEVARVTVTAGAATQDLIRNGKGQFANVQWQGLLQEVNARMALLIQEEVVALMQKGSKGRPETEDLLRATMNERNRYPRSTGS